MNNSPIVNKVAQSGIITISLEDFLPAGEWCEIDLRDFLFQESILKEKDFRERLGAINWSDYREKHVSVFCSVDAIIPSWAYMLVASKLQPEAVSIHFGSLAQAKESALLEALRNNLIPSEYSGARVVIKGCGDESINPSAYILAVELLQPVAKSLMYGEPCSTVPVYKQK